MSKKLQFIGFLKENLSNPRENCAPSACIPNAHSIGVMLHPPHEQPCAGALEPAGPGQHVGPWAAGTGWDAAGASPGAGRLQRYVTRVRRILPHNTPRSHWQRCYVPISLGHPAFRGRHLQALIEWVCQNSGSCCFVIGDDLARVNLQMEMGLDEDVALKIARQRGDAQLVALHQTLLKFPPGWFQIYRWRELTLIADTRAFREQIETIMESDELFAESINQSARDYLQRRQGLGRELAVPFEEALHLCRRYLAEELAVLCTVVSLGWTVEVYPGPELPVLAEILEGKFPSVPEVLRRRVSIELEITRTPQSAASATQNRHA